MAKTQKSDTARCPRGRPQGRRSTHKAVFKLTPELSRIIGRVDALLTRIVNVLARTSVVLEGHVGPNNALPMVRQCGWHRMANRRSDAALSLPDAGPDKGRGPQRTSGDELNDRGMSDQYLQQTQLAGHIQTCRYQAPRLHQEFRQPLNVVIIVKTHLQTGDWAQVILCSSDLALPDDARVDDYGRRFQIAFNVHDAEPYGGLEDLMTTIPRSVTKAANLSLCLVNLSYRLLSDFLQVLPLQHP